MIGCSGSHRDSKPNDSALCARTATSIDWLESVIFTPIFMLPSIDLWMPLSCPMLALRRACIASLTALGAVHPRCCHEAEDDAMPPHSPYPDCAVPIIARH